MQIESMEMVKEQEMRRQIGGCSELLVVVYDNDPWVQLWKQPSVLRRLRDKNPGHGT
jgi:hypothetical protein